MFSQTAPSIETVPQIFFTPDFNLSSPQTFATVCESAAQQILQSHNKNLTTSMSVAGLAAMADPSSLATSSNAVLQDRLSHYLDTVEVVK